VVTFASCAGHILQPHGSGICPVARAMGHHMMGLRLHGEVVHIATPTPGLCRGIALGRLGCGGRPLVTTESLDEHPPYVQREVGGFVDHEQQLFLIHHGQSARI
jgi:hypothetical protein